MKQLLKQLLFKLSQYTFLRKIASRIFVRFPKIKTILLNLLYSSPSNANMQNLDYKSSLLDAIKEDIQMKRNSRGL